VSKKYYYTIIKVNDRAQGIYEYNQTILSAASFIAVDDFNFIDGRILDAVKLLQDKKISLEGWSPWDKRLHYDIMSTEAAIWLNNIAIYQYIVDNDIDHFLVMEDDIKLSDNFEFSFKRILKEIPKGYDFVSLIDTHIEEPHTQNKVDSNTKINGKSLIHRSYNQYSDFHCILISKKGAKKILDFVYQKGIYYTIDCQIFDMSRRGILKGYSIRPDSRFIIAEPIDLGSIIDPDNKREEKVKKNI